MDTKVFENLALDHVPKAKREDENDSGRTLGWNGFDDSGESSPMVFAVFSIS